MDKKNAKKKKLVRMINYQRKLSKVALTVVNDSINGDFFSTLLTTIIELTNCEFGFIGLIKESEKYKHLRLCAIYNKHWQNKEEESVRKKISEGVTISQIDNFLDYELGIKLLSQINKKESLNTKYYHAIPTYVKQKKVAIIGLANFKKPLDKSRIEQLQEHIETINLMIELKKYQALIKKMVLLDEITPLYSQTYIEQNIPSIIKFHEEENKRFCLLLAKISNLQAIKNSLGNTLADAVLHKFSQRICKKLKAYDMIARITGGRFIIILHDISNRFIAESIIKRLINIMREPFKIDEYNIDCQPLIGISYYPTAGKNYQELIKNARIAIENGEKKKGFCFYEESLKRKAINRNQIVKELNQAIENDELQMVYQPQVHITTKLITGFEALLRWNHLTQGYISPATFIPLAEEEGLVEKINLYVLKKTINDFNNMFQQENYPLKLSINVSPHVKDLTKHCRELNKIIKKESDVYKNIKLELEITEKDISNNGEDMDNLSCLLRGMKKSHVSIAVDNFGLKKTSLDRLLNHNIDVLKINSQFTHALSSKNSKEAKSIISIILDIAKRLNFDVIAEGVETQQQADVLQSLGCAKAQGYYYYYPMPIEEVYKLLMAQNL